MRKFILLAVLAVTMSISALAQTPVEFYAGAVADRNDFDFRTAPAQQFTLNRSTDSFGGEFAVTGFFAKNVGLTGDVSATFNGGRNESSLLTALGGLTLKSRSGRFQPYVQVLAGVARQRIASDQLNFNVSDVNFAGDVGAGLDFKFKSGGHVGWRIIGVDYLRTSAFDAGTNGFLHGGQDHLRLSSGISF